jgi:hypothetical protein
LRQTNIMSQQTQKISFVIISLARKRESGSPGTTLEVNLFTIVIIRNLVTVAGGVLDVSRWSACRTDCCHLLSQTLRF